jgi:hypothetical protein
VNLLDGIKIAAVFLPKVNSVPLINKPQIRYFLEDFSPKTQSGVSTRKLGLLNWVYFTSVCAFQTPKLEDNIYTSLPARTGTRTFKTGSRLNRLTLTRPPARWNTRVCSQRVFSSFKDSIMDTLTDSCGWFA